MGIRFRCQACANKVNVKDFLAGKRGICPKCGAKFTIPEQSEPEFLATPDDPEPETTLPAPAASPAMAVSTPQQLGLPAAAPIATAATAGHSPHINSAQAYLSPQYPAQQPAPAPQHAAPYQPTMPAPGFHTAPVPTGPRDPFQEAPAAQWYVRHASGQQYGPAPAPMMQKWLAEGRVPGDGMVWREGWGDWQVASLIFPQLAAPPVPMARGPAAAPFAPQPQPGLYPAAAPVAPAAVSNPFGFDAIPASGTTSPASQYIHQRRDNSRMMLIISIVLMFAIAIVGGVLWYVLTKDNEEAEDVARREIAVCVKIQQLQAVA
jgi:hypothetical protein